MSFIKDVVKFFSGNSIASSLGKAAVLGLVLNRANKSVKKASNATKPDRGVRQQIDPDTQTAIPVVYGTTFIGGDIVDAVLSNDNKTMWYCLVLCEKTGTKLGDGQPSVITIPEIYWNGFKLFFQSDGITAAYIQDSNGTTSDKINGLMKIYAFSGNSTSPIPIAGFSVGNQQPAFNLFPNWTSAKNMSDLVFVLVRLEYNRDKDVTSLGTLEFKVNNTMRLAGDCLFDYMTNTRYGAGIDPGDIKSE